jgi:branched-chain amino acid transport system substrate-binding protein
MSTKIKSQGSFVIVVWVILGILLAGCSQSESATATPVPPTATPVPPTATPEKVEDTILIGAVFNATGWMAAYDQPPRQAALLAIQDINAQGGVLGRNLKLIELDGKTDPVTVEQATRQLVEQGSDVLVAPCDFDIGAPVSQVAQEAGLVGVSTCASSPLYGSLTLGDKQFTVGMWGNTMGAAMAEYGYEELGWRTAYVIVDTSIDYTLSLGDYFRQHFESLGGEIVGEDAYTAGQEDFSALIQGIQQAPEEPDVLYISGIMPDLGLVLRQVREAGIETPIAGGDTYDDTSLFDLLGAELGSEIYMATHSWLGSEVGGEMSRFIELFEAEYGEPPAGSFIVMGWDTVQVLAQAIEKAGTTDGAEVAKALEELEFELLSGKLDWTSAAEGHQPVKEAAIVALQEGQPIFLDWYRPASLPEP